MSSFDFEIHSDELAARHEYEMREDLAHHDYRDDLHADEFELINAELQLQATADDEDNYTDDDWQDEYDEYIANQTQHDDDRDLDYYAS